MSSNIIAHCIVRSNTVILDGKIIYQESNNAENLETFLTNVYRHWGISYPKFFKMDILSKLAFITAEKMLENRSFCGSDMALVLSNNSSSIMSDIHHQKSIQKPESYFPSPAVFVYTLVNIMLGELCIRHKITGENTVFIHEKFEKDLQINYSNYLIDRNLCKMCINGRIDVSPHGYEAFFYLTQQEYALGYNIHKLVHTPENIEKLHHQKIQKFKEKNVVESDGMALV